MNSTPHNFHIPVMGIGFTIDTPLKVAPFGIDSVISLVDDVLLERLRGMYCRKFGISYTEIPEAAEDFRALRITAYLNLLQDLAQQQFQELKQNALQGLKSLETYFQMLPDTAPIRLEFQKLLLDHCPWEDLRKWASSNFYMGSLDVNIMTKVDKDNYRDGEKLPVAYNDAHAALRGYAQSKLSSSLVLSAGLNPRLYSYLEQFDDFYPDAHGQLKKKIILKVSDFRSALIQGKFLAKKGIWVSEFRVESGLNCGGHAFATEGQLLGPILADFRDRREELLLTLHEILLPVLEKRGGWVPNRPQPVKISAQGGVGTADEHQFILQHYQVGSVGWGTPFLLVPEATTVDQETLEKLVAAKEDDLYLSDISPLGVPFNSLKGNTKDLEKWESIKKGRPGSSCPRKFVALNKEFGDRGLCTASRQYQYLKIKELEAKEYPTDEFERQYDKITEKSCTCVGLGTAALLVHKMDTRKEGQGVSICPGPNMAYFDRIMSLREIIDHIYGRANMIHRTDRPHMFIKELDIYLDYLQNAMARDFGDPKQQKYYSGFAENLGHGIDYYIKLAIAEKWGPINMGEELEKRKERLMELMLAEGIGT
tara:strand:- start:5391 stop:7175 length:1785 start_codon:yes stop_codon:yes gene_type:complete